MFKRETRVANLRAAIIGAGLGEHDSVAVINAGRTALKENRLLNRRGNLKRWVGKALGVGKDVPAGSTPQRRPEVTFDDRLENFTARGEHLAAEITFTTRKLIRDVIMSVLTQDAVTDTRRKVNKRFGIR